MCPISHNIGCEDESSFYKPDRMAGKFGRRIICQINGILLKLTLPNLFKFVRKIIWQQICQTSYYTHLYSIAKQFHFLYLSK